MTKLDALSKIKIAKLKEWYDDLSQGEVKARHDEKRITI